MTARSRLTLAELTEQPGNHSGGVIVLEGSCPSARVIWQRDCVVKQ